MKERDPLDIRAHEREAKERDEREQLLSRREADDFKFLMSDKRGRRFVWNLLEKTGVFRSSFTGNSETFFREGQRNVGLMIVDMIHTHSPEQYNRMMMEQRGNDKRNADDDGNRKHRSR
jgi:hypothetical protein